VVGRFPGNTNTVRSVVSIPIYVEGLIMIQTKVLEAVANRNNILIIMKHFNITKAEYYAHRLEVEMIKFDEQCKKHKEEIMLITQALSKLKD